jgi:hypothetical protein
MPASPLHLAERAQELWVGSLYSVAGHEKKYPIVVIV